MIELYLHVVNMTRVLFTNYDGPPMMIDILSHLVVDIKIPKITVYYAKWTLVKKGNGLQ